MEIEILLVVLAVVALATVGGVLTSRRRRIPRAPEEPPASSATPDATTEAASVDRAPIGTRPAGDVSVGDARGDGLGEPQEPVGEDPTSRDVAGAPSPDAAMRAPSIPEEPRARVRGRLARTRNLLSAQMAELFGRGVSEESWEGLEEVLIAADVGVTAATELVEHLRVRSRQEGATSQEAVEHLLASELRSLLGGADRSLVRRPSGTSVWLVTGVNGTGKTTTIGKLAAREARDGRQVVLAAADTFRAAAADQLGVWAERTGGHLVRKDEGADPASVAYEGVDAAHGRGADLLIVDTAGRLHNKRELMDELGKVKRVLDRQAEGVDEVLLVLDATTGQNGIAQARAFLDAVDVTGIALTKLDGSSKGGIVVAVQRELGIPVKLVGLGEEIDDLEPFDPDLFVEGLIGE